MTSSFALVPSAVDTKRFGRPIGRIEIDEPSPAAQLVEDFIASDLEILVVRYPARHHQLFSELVHDDVVVIHADTLCYFGGTIADNGREPRHEFLTESIPHPSDELRTAVGVIFHGYRNHYAANPLVDPRLVVRGYEEWTDAHLGTADQAVIVLRDRATDVIVALAAVTVEGETIEIDLAGVVPTSRGRGVYQDLLDEVTRRGAELGCRHITISTQASNLAATRAWVRRGWLPERTLETVHVVRRTAWERR